MERKQMTPSWRRLIIIGSGLSIAFGVQGLVAGNVASGVFLGALGFFTLVGVLRHWEGSRKDEKERLPFYMIKAYCFFGIGGICGIAMFLLAIMGNLREPVLFGVMGLCLAGIAAYVLVKSAIDRRG
jgi:hypothetical protein